MLSDPRTFSALVAGLIRDEPAPKPVSRPAPVRKVRFEGSFSPEQLGHLMSLGLTDRDLDFMGPQQRNMVMDILRNAIDKSVAA